MSVSSTGLVESWEQFGGFSTLAKYSAVLISFYLVVQVIYNLYFHPLAHLPGPRLWAAFRWRYVLSLVSGSMRGDITAMHAKYGEIVRTAPDEVSFARPEVYPDVFSGSSPLQKDPIFFTPPLGQDHSLVTTPDHAQHARMRRVLNYAFSPAAMKSLEGVVESYVDLMMQRLKSLKKTNEGKEKSSAGNQDSRSVTIANMAAWYNYVTFDIIGDLTFGESFNCLQTGDLHPWVGLIFQFLKGMTLAAGARFYPWIDFVLIRFLVPRSMLRQAEEHYNFTSDKIARRIKLESPRQDFMAPVLESGLLETEQVTEKDSKKVKGMTLKELDATAGAFIIAGSETVATTLSGITTYFLVDGASTQPLDRLTKEIRSNFNSADEITIASTQNLPYLNAVVSEGLRLANPVPLGVPRSVPLDRPATVCGVNLPPGTHVMTPQGVIARNEEYFRVPAPVDEDDDGDERSPAVSALEFRPERWLAASDEHALPQIKSGKVTFSPPTLHPFSLGPRNCPGQRLAMWEMRLILARLVWEFDLKKAGDEKKKKKITPWEELKTFVILQREELWVELRERQDE